MSGILSGNMAQLMMIAGAGALIMHWSQDSTKNSGTLATDQVSADQDPTDEYATVTDITGRDPHAACNIHPTDDFHFALALVGRTHGGRLHWHHPRKASGDKLSI